uniref:cDNA FLJ37811 fis, clone BRSSN2001869, moderately similar to Ankyrin repeat domain-containing protein 13 n=1 Tax=Homo sapiens TaxID=9606 RepID=B3KT78_HUMAN|nr:unnamed protein product [Homo sapiens]
MHGLHLEMLMAVALPKNLYLKMWKGPRLIQELSGPASNGGISQTNTYDAQYERAIQESLLTSTEGLCPSALSETSRFDNDLQLAMELSAKELEEWELRLQEEEAELQQVLQLSLTDK